MISQKYMVNTDAGWMEAAHAAETFAIQASLGRRETLRLRLLMEETLGMVKTTLGDFYGQLWFTEDNGVCAIHFEATADMDADKKIELLSVSSSGRNASARGFMSRLGEFISGVIHGFGTTLDVYGQETIRYGIVHTPNSMAPNADMMPIWTLQTYKTDLEQASAKDRAAEHALEDLERSIVASLADDIVVGVRGDRVSMTITKDFGNA